MVRALIFALAALVAGCASTPDVAPPHARIAEDVALTLPLPPAYPETRTIVQTGRARYGERQAAFEAVLSLSPARVEIVLTMLSGPRLATVTWDEAGIREDRSPFAPEGVPVENILADIFVALWPVEAVAAALPAGVNLSVDAEGQRTIRRGEEIIVNISPVSEGRTLVRNAPFDYEVSLVSQSLE